MAVIWCAGETGPHLTRSVEKHIRWFWRFIMCPLLFGLIGTTINFKTLPSSTIPRSVAIIIAGRPSIAAGYSLTLANHCYVQ